MNNLIKKNIHRRKLSNASFVREKTAKKVLTLNITSLLDVMIILLIFLLMNYSNVPQIHLSKNIQLPYSTSNENLVYATRISISKDWILLDGEPIIAVDEVKNRNSKDIPIIMNHLKARAANQKSRGIGEFEGKILLQADREIRFELIKKILYSCGNTEYNNILLTLIQEKNPHYLQNP